MFGKETKSFKKELKEARNDVKEAFWEAYNKREEILSDIDTKKLWEGLKDDMDDLFLLFMDLSGCSTMCLGHYKDTSLVVINEEKFPSDISPYITKDYEIDEGWTYKEKLMGLLETCKIEMPDAIMIDQITDTDILAFYYEDGKRLEEVSKYKDNAAFLICWPEIRDIIAEVTIKALREQIYGMHDANRNLERRIEKAEISRNGDER